MGLILNIFFFGTSFAVLSIAGYYATDAAVKVTKIPNYKDNQKLKSAHSYLSWAAVVTWITVALLLIAGILYLFFAWETAEETGGYVIDFFLGISLLAVITVGILSAVGAADVNDSGVSDKKNANRQAVIAAILAIVGFVLIVGLLLYKLLYNPKKNKQKKEQKLEYSLEAQLAGGDDNWELNELNV